METKEDSDKISAITGDEIEKRPMLTLDQRMVIEDLLSKGARIDYIASIMQKGVATIYREVRFNEDLSQYNAIEAHRRGAIRIRDGAKKRRGKKRPIGQGAVTDIFTSGVTIDTIHDRLDAVEQHVKILTETMDKLYDRIR